MKPEIITDDTRDWLEWMNRIVPHRICRLMPANMRDKTMLAIQKHLTGFGLGQVRFFDKFQPPCWTLLYWMHPTKVFDSSRALEPYMRTQALAMFIHVLDDHLCDGQIPVDPLFLHLRTVVWRAFAEDAVEALGVDPEEFEGHAGRYVSSTQTTSRATDYYDYVQRFRDEVAIGLVAPLALASHVGMRPVPVLEMFEVFATACRLIDDLRDSQEDAAAGRKTAVDFARDLNMSLSERILISLDSAKSMADHLGLPNLAREYSVIAQPFRQEVHENLP